MTLNDILVASLAQLDRGHDAQTLDIFRKRLTGFANDAQSDLARAIRFSRTDIVMPTGGVVDTSMLSRPCLRVESVKQLGHVVRFGRGDTTGCITLPYDTEATITYRCVPSELSSPTDVSELPIYVHGLIVCYVIARERMAGDVNTQRGSDIYLSMYEMAKAKLRPHMGEPESYMIVNRY